MKKMLFFTFFIIAVPSFFILNKYKEENYFYEKNKNDKIEIEKEKEEIKEKNIEIKVLQTKSNKIIKLNIEEYVKGVIAGEMPLTFNEEALKAQAVAARTYALRRINENNKYDVVDTVMNQVYLSDESLKEKLGLNYEFYLEKIENVIKETKGEYVDYNGTYADTLFFSTSVGSTENSEEIFGTKVSYLQSVSSEWDEEVSPVYKEKNTFSRNTFCNKLNLNDCSKVYVNIVNKTSTGRIKNIIINNKNFTGTEVAYNLGIRSNYFDIYIENNNVVVETKGFGHGVGMSQYGAEGMANNGYTYKEILTHYYQGTTIKNLYV